MLVERKPWGHGAGSCQATTADARQPIPTKAAGDGGRRAVDAACSVRAGAFLVASGAVFARGLRDRSLGAQVCSRRVEPGRWVGPAGTLRCMVVEVARVSR